MEKKRYEGTEELITMVKALQEGKSYPEAMCSYSVFYDQWEALIDMYSAEDIMANEHVAKLLAGYASLPVSLIQMLVFAGISDLWIAETLALAKNYNFFLSSDAYKISDHPYAIRKRLWRTLIENKTEYLSKMREYAHEVCADENSFRCEKDKADAFINFYK